MLFIGAFLLSVVYIPGFVGAATSSRWAFLSLVLPIGLIARYNATNFTLVHCFGLLFLLLCGLSLFWSYNYLAFYDLVKFLLLAQAFVLGTFLLTLEGVFAGLALGLLVSAVLVLFGMTGGLFVNVNTLAEISAIVLVGVCVYRLWSLIPGLLYLVLVNSSRGAVLALAVTGACWLWGRSRLLALALTGVVILMLFLSFHLGYHLDSLYDRLAIWKLVLQHVTWFGNGLGSFALFGYYNIISRPMFVHNDLLQILFELGIVGALLIIGFFVLIMRSHKNEKYIVLACLIVSCFDFPLFLPVSAFVVFLVCGFLARDRNMVFLPTAHG